MLTLNHGSSLAGGVSGHTHTDGRHNTLSTQVLTSVGLTRSLILLPRLSRSINFLFFQLHCWQWSIPVLEHICAGVSLPLVLALHVEQYLFQTTRNNSFFVWLPIITDTPPQTWHYNYSFGPPSINNNSDCWYSFKVVSTSFSISVFHFAGLKHWLGQLSFNFLGYKPLCGCNCTEVTLTDPITCCNPEAPPPIAICPSTAPTFTVQIFLPVWLVKLGLEKVVLHFKHLGWTWLPSKKTVATFPTHCRPVLVWTSIMCKYCLTFVINRTVVFLVSYL